MAGNRKTLNPEEFPGTDALKEELYREQHKHRFLRRLKKLVITLIVTAAAVELLSTMFFPVFKIYGTSMMPTMSEGDIVIAFKGSSFTTGDVVGLYSGNRVLVKRIIAGPGQWVDIDENGTVYVDGKSLDEPYLSEKALGNVNIELPYQVPEGHYFVMGDHRSTSLDSRSTAVGSIAEDQIVGRIVFRIWPIGEFGLVK